MDRSRTHEAAEFNQLFLVNLVIFYFYASLEIDKDSATNWQNLTFSTNFLSPYKEYLQNYDFAMRPEHFFSVKFQFLMPTIRLSTIFHYYAGKKNL
jgi:hypothetical protein